jgi:high affinity choline transporter 7
LNVIIGISYLWGVILSAIVALAYTLAGGLSSVAYTDVVQLVGIVCGVVRYRLFLYTLLGGAI